ncbi:MAG: DUF2855 family protein, partial [Rhodobacteraceae bacterium]|nr:DUF2855 family protein [Paracoccaceae bacterium]
MNDARILVNQKDITRIQTDFAAAPALAEGQARLRLESFALTANNVTYAAVGFQIGYWQFFPTEVADHGLVPVWGVAVVAESRSGAQAGGPRGDRVSPKAGT